MVIGQYLEVTNDHFFCRFGSQFFITLGENLDSLDGEHLVFGQVVEGLDVIGKLNQTLTDGNNRPYQDIRISHTVILNDPYPDPDNLDYPDESPKPTRDILESDYIAADENIDDTEGKTMEEIQEEIAEREAKARATILEMVGDLPDSDMAPPENVLFVCKLNPVTTSDDLEIIFSRFGKINSCEVIRDRITENSLQYSFIEFAETKSCEDAYFKMDNVLIDDRRIHVDFSQSVSKIRWRGKGKGVEYFDDSGRKVDGKRGQMYDPNKDYDRPNDRNRNFNRGRGGWEKDFRSSNGGPRPYHRDFNKPWDRDRRYQPRGRNGGMNRNPRDNRDWERYDGGRPPFGMDDRDDRHGRRHEGRRNDREEERNSRNKEKHESRRNERDGRHNDARSDRQVDRHEGKRSDGDSRHLEDKGERHSDKPEHKRNDKELKGSDEKHETRRPDKDEKYEAERSHVMESKFLEDVGNKHSADHHEGPSRGEEEEEETHKRKRDSEDSGDDIPSDDEAKEKLLKHLKKSLKKKKKKHKKYNSESDSDGKEEEKEKKKKKKRKKKKKASSDSDESDFELEVKKKNKKSKKKKKKASSNSEDSNSDSDSKRKSKKSKKKKKKKKKEVSSSDSSD